MAAIDEPYARPEPESVPWTVEQLGADKASALATTVAELELQKTPLEAFGRRTTTSRAHGLFLDTDADYTYSGAPTALPMHDWMRTLGAELVQLFGLEHSFNVCIVNRYDEGASRGLHKLRSKRHLPDMPVVTVPVGPCGNAFYQSIKLPPGKKRRASKVLLMEEGSAVAVGPVGLLEYKGGTRPHHGDVRHDIVFMAVAAL